MAVASSSRLSIESIEAAALNLAVSARELLGLPVEYAKDSSLRPTIAYDPPHLDEPPSALAFLQRINGNAAPFLISDCLCDRPATRLWKDTSHLRSKMKGRSVRVALTPDGRADDLKLDPQTGEIVFGLPAEVEMPFEELLDKLGSSSSSKTESIEPVYYLQSQDNNLLSGELGPFLDDLMVEYKPQEQQRYDLPWATDAFDSLPEASNLWIGGSKSQSSMHRDHYENFFTVTRGRKKFTIFPPTEAFFLCQGGMTYDVKRHSEKAPYALKEDDTPGTPWIPIDPTEAIDSPRNVKWKRYARGLKPLSITVEEGMTLFLPAGYYHHVSQEGDSEGLCIAINYWYESTAAFGSHWSLLEFAREIGDMTGEGDG